MTPAVTFAKFSLKKDRYWKKEPKEERNNEAKKEREIKTTTNGKLE